VLVDPVYFEIDLKVKGTAQSEDQDLIFEADPFMDPPRLLKVSYTSEISTLEMTLGHIRSSAEATISMRVIHGSWPDGSRCAFAAKTASIDGVEFALLLTGDDALPVAEDGTIGLQCPAVPRLRKRRSIWKCLSRLMVLLMLCLLNLRDTVDSLVCSMLVHVRLRSLLPGPV
jgi:hypothetical protein